MKKYCHHSFIDGFDQSNNKKKEQENIRQYESDILREIKCSKEKQVSVSKYIANFSLKEKRCFLGLIKRFERVKISYRWEEGMTRQYLIVA
ncbi:hypothetical protein KI126_002303 [Enterococcus faecium]|uniref:hypothetical protein n=1 Tax=Enterococcus faecalis TaxID=1351 RepID=UPI0019F73AF4|nr:hypothetical protein [Enterococcus faecalis]EME8274767.1 hypothetical protein [Enterococcus faecium]EGO8095171.1 hypothetical protein [Enterococcus faecalis]EGO8511460.1 hypothetical protein [Enterococcus faecalis]EHK9411949.1 hypothetical protein [Enterococcus faecalis]EHQ8833480.1 hypothetical protein [Enterococcus faecalis]